MKNPLTRRRAAYLGLACLVLLIVGELAARFALGLGDPPLSVEHGQIEYMFAPDQDCNRFGNRIHINAYGMRSEDFPKTKPDPNEYRVMVLGDSVTNGGNLTDQAELATTLLQDELAKTLGRPVVVGNISAGSWGPANLLAYVQTYGLFEADLILIVISSHDAADTPTFQPLSPDTHPTQAPISALWEGITRYLPRYLPTPGSSPAPGSAPEANPNAGPTATDPPTPADPQALDAFRELLTLAQQTGARVAVIQHWTREELTTNQPEPGHAELAQIAADLSIPTYQTADTFRQAPDPATLYRDNIHPNTQGQEALLETLKHAAKEE